MSSFSQEDEEVMTVVVWDLGELAAKQESTVREYFNWHFAPVFVATKQINFVSALTSFLICTSQDYQTNLQHSSLT